MHILGESMHRNMGINEIEEQNHFILQEIAKNKINIHKYIKGWVEGMQRTSV